MSNRRFFTQCCAAELPMFVKVLEALPEDQLDYRPHPVSRSARELVGHLIGHEQDLVELADTGSVNHRMQVPFTDLEEAVALFRAARQDLTAKLEAMDDATWDGRQGQFIVDGRVVYELPSQRFAWLLLFDSIHHRGQLSTYIRPMGGKVPALYGPSADDSGGH